MSSPSPVEPLDTTGPSGETKPADSPIEIYRHSSAHLLAAAVTELFPDAQCGIGPPTDDGFFYDFLVSEPFTPEDLVAIEKKMAHIVKQNRPIEKKLAPEGRGARALREEGPDAEVRADRRRSRATPSSATRWASSSTSASGRTCRRRRTIKAFKLKAEPAAAYWKGKEGNPSMQRIYGYAFFTKEELDQHLLPHRGGQAPRPPQARPRARPVLDRRRDGRRASCSGTRRAASSASRSRTTGATSTSRAATTSSTRPHIARLDLWKTSGHTEYYKANMYSPIEIENVEYQLKPTPIEIYRHSSAHLLAAAVTELFPDAQCGIGPPTDDGFFYDFLVAQPFTPEDLVAIEKKMAHIVKQNRPIEKKLAPEGRGARAVREEGPDAEVRADRGEVGRPRPVLHDGRVHRLLPRAAPRVDEGDQGLQAEGRARRRLLEGQGGQPVDAAHLRVRLLHEGGARRSTSSGSRRRSAATTASSAASSTSSRSPTRRAPGSCSGTRRAASSASRSRTTGATSTSRAATTSSTRRTSRSSTSGRRAGTPSTTRRTCTRRSRSRTSSTS